MEHRPAREAAQRGRLRGIAVVMVIGGIALVVGGGCRRVPDVLNNEAHRATRETAGDPLSPEQVALLEPGDFILRRGVGVMSRVIVGVLGGDEGFSHSGILYRDDQGQWMVVHSVSRTLAERDGVQEEPLHSFVRQSVSRSTAVVRLRASRETRDEMVAAALEVLASGAPFDTTFQLDNPAVYCSELLWRALPEDVRHGAALFHNPGGVLRFESFLDPRYFERIVDRRSPEG